MKQELKKTYIDFMAGWSGQEAEVLDNFFQDFEAQCLMSGLDRVQLRHDFVQAISYYTGAGVSLDRALELLASRRLSGFYARPPTAWFPLDDAAKIYPLAMSPGRMTVFRLAAQLTEPVVPELLQMALNFTITYFPSFATTLKKGFFWHYLDSTKRRFNSAEENDIPCRAIDVSASRSQSFRLLYYKNRISAEFFHVLTDGSGGMAFLQAILAEYLRLRHPDDKMDQLVAEFKAIPLAEKSRNAFAEIAKTPTKSGFINRRAVQIGGPLSRARPCRIIHFKLNADQLRAVARSYRATIGAYMTGLIFMAVKASTDELSGEISVQVPVNMRKFYPSRTVRNFALYAAIRQPIDQLTDLARVVGEAGLQLKQKAGRQAMDQMATSAKGIVDSFKYVPLMIKQPFAQIGQAVLGDKAFSCTFSNLGLVDLPEPVGQYVESLDFVLDSASSKRAGCALVTNKQVANFSIVKLTKDPSFETEIYRLLLADGLEVSLEGSPNYDN